MSRSMIEGVKGSGAGNLARMGYYKPLLLGAVPMFHETVINLMIRVMKYMVKVY